MNKQIKVVKIEKVKISLEKKGSAINKSNLHNEISSGKNVGKDVW